MTTFSLRHSSHLYEFFLRGSRILSITRYSETNSIGKELVWDHLPDEVKEMAERRLKEKEEE